MSKWSRDFIDQCAYNVACTVVDNSTVTEVAAALSRFAAAILDEHHKATEDEPDGMCFDCTCSAPSMCGGAYCAREAEREPAADRDPEAERPDSERGVYRKYSVQRLNDPTGKHRECTYFVLDEVHDKFAGPALRAYADACESEFPDLARDLRARHPGGEEGPWRCEHCGAKVACFGSYEGRGSGFACDECCGHGCEDGRCIPVVGSSDNAEPTPAATESAP